jgi:hypothetical protein
MGKKSGPAPPDYKAAAEQQAQSSKEVTNMQTYANRPDQTTPWGTMTWDAQKVRDPSTGQMVTKWNQNVNLSPEEQRALDAQRDVEVGRSEMGADMMGRVQDEFGQVMDWSKFAKAGGDVNAEKLNRTLGGADQYTGQAGDALHAAFEERMNPRFERDTAALETTLRNRGLKPGDEAYDRALSDMRQSQGDQRNQAMYQAQQMNADEAARLQAMDQTGLTFGNEAAGQQFGMNLTASDHDTQRRVQQITEEMQQRGFSLNEINALLTGQMVQAPQFGSFQAANRSDATNYSGAAQQQFAANQQQHQNKRQAVMDMVGAVSAPFSMGV